MTLTQRECFETEVRASRDRLIALCRTLVRTRSENLPGDTSEIAALVEAVLQDLPDLEIRRFVAKEPAVNLLVRLKGAEAGPRLVINGHLDTFPAGLEAGWSAPPFSGELRNGRLYGRGAADMKAGLAAALLTTRLLAERRGRLAGELVLALVGDEETGGHWGTEWLLANVPEALGDAMLSGDAGSPRVLRFGEKGRIWLRIAAAGKAAHGAHVHLGENAIEKLQTALQRLFGLRHVPVPMPAEIAAAIAEAAPVSESMSGAGEIETLSGITVNIGRIEGGNAPNLVPDHAEALVDLRFPPGVTRADIAAWLAEQLGPMAGISHEMVDGNEANWTSPNHPIVQTVRANAVALLGGPIVANMRVGYSDARFYRDRGIPSVVYGPTPYNMGGVDEYVLVDDLFAVFYVHAMTAYDFLARPGAG